MSSLTTSLIEGTNASVALKAPVACATTANITLSGEQTLDSVTTSSSRVLVKNQTTTTENGVYISSSSAWTRALDFDGSRDVVTGTMVFVTGGSTLANTLWRVSTSGDPEPGEAMAFTQVQLTGATGATGPAGPTGATGAAGTIDITTQAAETSPDATNDLLLIYDNSEGANNKMTPANFLKSINGLTEETTVDATADFIPIYDTSGSTADKMTPANFLKAIDGLTAETSPDATADFIPIYDTSGTSTDKITPANLMKIINGLTEDTSPDGALDFFVTYDASASSAKKVTFESFLKWINSLTADGSPDTSADYVVTYDASSGLPKKVLLNLIGTGAAATTTSSGSVELATSAEVQTGSDTGRVPSVSVMGSHQSSAKFWADVTNNAGTQTLSDSYNVTSITDGTNEITVTIGTNFASANWCCLTSVETGDAPSNTVAGIMTIASKAAGTVIIEAYDLDGTKVDVSNSAGGWQVAGFGDQ